jgi:Domain of unknown function (DUF397)
MMIVSQSIDWRKSSFSGNNVENHCVELALAFGRVKLRESDLPTRIITTTPARLALFIRAVKAGDLDHLKVDPQTMY